MRNGFHPWPKGLRCSVALEPTEKDKASTLACHVGRAKFSPILGGQAFTCARGGGGIEPPGRSCPPPQKKGAPQNPTETDPQASEVTRTQKLAKNENRIFGISASKGCRKVIICHTFSEKKFDPFSWSKNFSAPLAAELIITDEWSCQLSPFPRPRPPVLGGLC